MEVIRKLIKEGYSVNEIRKKTGFTQSIVYQAKRDMKKESRQLYSEGNTLKDIADTLDISLRKVKYLLYETGNKPKILPKEKLTEFQQNRIRQLLICRDYTLHEIADEIGSSINDVKRFVSNN